MNVFGNLDNLLRAQRPNGDDFLQGGEENDFALGLLGNDVIDLGAGNDAALGGSGNDTLIGGPDDGQLIASRLLDLGNPFADQNLPNAIPALELDPEDLVQPGEFVSVETEWSQSIEPVFVVGDLQRLPNGDVIATLLFEYGTDPAGAIQPCFLVADDGNTAFQVDLEPISANVPAFVLAVNLGQNLSGTLTFEAGFEDDLGNVTTIQSGVGLPADLNTLPEIEAEIAIENFAIGDLLDGGRDGDTFLYDPLNDGVDELRNFEPGLDQITIAGVIAPCFVPRENGTLVLFEDANGQFLDNAAILLRGIDSTTVANDPSLVFGAADDGILI